MGANPATIAAIYAQLFALANHDFAGVHLALTSHVRIAATAPMMPVTAAAIMAAVSCDIPPATEVRSRIICMYRFVPSSGPVVCSFGRLYAKHFCAHLLFVSLVIKIGVLSVPGLSSLTDDGFLFRTGVCVMAVEQNSISIDMRILELEKLCSTTAITQTPVLKRKPSSVRLESPGTDNTPIFITNDTNNKRALS